MVREKGRTGTGKATAEMKLLPENGGIAIREKVKLSYGSCQAHLVSAMKKNSVRRGQERWVE
ncbi:unnamed protein product [Prunus armeniaca]|uniref:Uncharacterized protein n=1 Tax=Prunus armeniaca TaxID=36596 RepID=A0A6J5W4S5_PRUAR|nr:unnamed protein product [Prunus armeniaca]